MASSDAHPAGVRVNDQPVSTARRWLLRQWPVLVGLVAAGVVLESLARVGVGLPDVRPVLLLAVAWAALAGGRAATGAAVLLTLLYVAHYETAGHPAASPFGGAAWRVGLYALAAPVLGALVLLARGRAESRHTRAFEDERSAVKLRVRAGEELNRAVLGSLPAHIAVVDADGVIVTTNEAWDRFAEENGGAASAAARGVGANYLEACRGAGTPDAHVASEVAAGVRAVLDGTRDEFRTEYPCQAPGRERWFLLSVTPLGDVAGAGNGQGGNGQPGRRRGAVVAHFDITDRKNAEQALARRVAEYAALAGRLKKSNDELDQFAYVTSHDLRAPLRGIANLSRWIEEDIGEHFTPEAHRQMELLRGRVTRMEAMIDGILEYSRVGRVKHRAEPVDVAALLAEVIDLLDVPTRFTVAVAAGMPTVFGERLRLQQVFQNLIGNAIKHHDKPTGRISVGWKDAAQGPGEWVEFSVSDDGPGIEPQYHEKVFVIFQTLEARDKVEGTGVGLSLVRKIVESQGGAITVESEKGKGATFRFTWPRQLASGDGGVDDAAGAPAARARS